MVVFTVVFFTGVYVIFAKQQALFVAATTCANPMSEKLRLERADPVPSVSEVQCMILRRAEFLGVRSRSS